MEKVFEAFLLVHHFVQMWGLVQSIPGFAQSEAQYIKLDLPIRGQAPISTVQ